MTVAVESRSEDGAARISFSDTSGKDLGGGLVFPSLLEAEALAMSLLDKIRDQMARRGMPS